MVAFFLKKKTNYTIRGWYTLRIETRNFGGEAGPVICWLASRWWRRRLGQHWTPRAQQQQMTVSIWKALHQSAECVASALDMQLFFPPPLAVHLSLNDADFNILAFTFVINAMPSRASQSITPNPPTVLFDCSGLMDVQSPTIRTVPLSTAKEPYWHCHHSSIGILLLFSSERRTSTWAIDWSLTFLSFYFFLSMMSNLGPPHISGSVTSKQTFRLGETVKLDCPIRGTPTPIVEWYKVNICFALHFILGFFFWS